MIYELSYSWYEDYSPSFFDPPPGVVHTQDEWQSLCDSLLDEAASRAIAKMPDQYVGWDEIVLEVGVMLTERGYSLAARCKANYWGACIIRDAEDRGPLSTQSFEKIIAHNEANRRGPKMEEVQP